MSSAFPLSAVSAKMDLKIEFSARASEASHSGPHGLGQKFRVRDPGARSIIAPATIAIPDWDRAPGLIINSTLVPLVVSRKSSSKRKAE